LGTVNGGAIDYGSKIPPYRQLAAFIRARIESGAIPPGRRVPSFTEARGEFGIADKTYRKAIGVLREEGLVETEPGMGSYVTERPTA
jgi:GntR family transcriptional regulator